MRWNEPALARKLAAGGFTYHVMSPFEPAVPDDGVVVRHMLDAATTLVVTLYDAIPFVFPEWYQRDDATRAFFRRRAELLRVADAVLAISENTWRDAIARLGLEPGRVHHIGSGPSPRPDHTDRGVELSAKVHKPFVLTVTGWGEPRQGPAHDVRGVRRTPRIGARRGISSWSSATCPMPAARNGAPSCARARPHR